MLHCKVCGGNTLLGNNLISSDRHLCKCTKRMLFSAGDSINEGMELLHLQSRQFELQDHVTELLDKMHRLDVVKPLEHDVDDHLKGNPLTVHQPVTMTINGAPRRSLSTAEHVVPPSFQNGRSQLTHCGTCSTALDQAEMRPSTAPGGPISEMNSGKGGIVDLRDLREELAVLRRKIDEELKSMCDVLLGNAVRKTRPFGTSKVATETEGKENTVPGSILSGAQQALHDVTRRRRVFETSVANCERSRAQRNVFDILGHLDAGDDDALRMRALLDDAVNNLEISQKPRSIPPKASNPPSRFARLSAPKQTNIASRQHKKSTNQRPLSLSPASTAVSTSPRGRSTGLADLVDFSTTKTTTAPLMKRPKVVLPSNVSPGADSQVVKRGKSVRFEKMRSRPRSTPRVTSFIPSLDKKTQSFLPLGMRQYSMWPMEKNQVFTSPALQTTASARPTVADSDAGNETLAQALKQLIPLSALQQPESTSEDKLTQSDLRTILDAALKDYFERQISSTKPSQIHSQLRDVNVGICSQDFMQEEALSPIHSPAKLTLIDRASSPQSIPESPEVVSRGNSVQSAGKPRSSSLPSITSEVIVTSEKLRTRLIIETESGTKVPGSDHIAAVVFRKGLNFPSEYRYEATEDLDANRSEVCSNTWNISTTQMEIKITQPLMAANNRCTSSLRLSVNAPAPVLTQSSIVAADEGVSTLLVLASVEEEEESGGRDSFSLTEPHTFSDGVWLDADRSEGEAGEIAMLGAEGVANLAREMGPLPSSSESSETTNSASEVVRDRSEGEFTLDQVNRQLAVWVAPWRDPLLHLIALNAAGKNSKLPWNQQHKIQRVARRLERRDDNHASHYTKTCSSSTEDLSWVEGMVGRVSASLAPSTATNEMRSLGEVVLPISVKQQLRRTILANSSQRMRQRDFSLSDEENTLDEVVEEAPTEKQDLLSAVESFSDEESKEIGNDEIDEKNSLESHVNSTSKGDSTFDIDPDVSSNSPQDSL